MSVYFRKDKNRWEAKVQINGKNKRRMFISRDEAVLFESQVRTAKLEGRPLTELGGKLTAAYVSLGQLLTEVETNRWAGRKSEEDLMRNGAAIVKVLGGDLDIRQVSTGSADRCVTAFRAEDNKPATINRKLSALSAMLSYAHERQWIPAIPSIPWQREPKGRCKFFTPEEENQIVSWFMANNEPDMADLVVLLIETGARLSEILDLPAGCCGDQLIVLKETKTDRTRSVPVTETARRILQRRCKGLEAHQPIFPYNGYHVEYRWGLMRATLGKEQDKEWVLHSLRHTYASRLVSSGHELYTVSQALGHSSITTTQRYAHLSPQALAGVAKTLERIRNPVYTEKSPEATQGDKVTTDPVTHLKLVS